MSEREGREHLQNQWDLSKQSTNFGDNVLTLEWASPKKKNQKPTGMLNSGTVLNFTEM